MADKIETNMAEDLERYPDRFQETFRGKTLFITGGSGFIGKVLVEKILRLLDVQKIYLLLREKKGKSPQQRMKDIFDNPLFNTATNVKGQEIFNKCKLIAGDASVAELGMSKEDRKTIIEEVDFIFHAAATIRFDDPLKKSVLLNVRATKYMLELAKEMKKLKAFVHISTCFCQDNQLVLYEKGYPPLTDPHQLIKQVENMDENKVELLASKLLGDAPNNYAFTKNLAEALCAEEIENLPLIVVRPSIVVPIWLEPLPGWIDNFNGPVGLLIAAGKGVLKSMYCKNLNNSADFMPADILANALIAAVWDSVDNGRIRRYYNVCASKDYRLSWGTVIDLGKRVMYERICFNNVIWCPGGSMKESWFLHMLCVIFLHYVPAVFIDAILVCLGYKPVLLRVYQRISKGMDVLQYYTNKQWYFSNELFVQTRELLNPRERATYRMNGDGINYLDYFTNSVYAARRYMLNEPDETIPAAKRHLKMMCWLDFICKTLFLLTIIYLSYKYVFCKVLARC